jgi:hypothetical protein
MSLLKTEGFDSLVAAVAREAREATIAAESAQLALTLGDRVDPEVGRRALTEAERIILAAAEDSGAALDASGTDGDRLVLALTGRLRIIPEGATAPADGHLLGTLKWNPGRPDWLAARWQQAQGREQACHTGLRNWLAAEPASGIRQRLGKIAHAVIHMAPVMLYVGARHYSNLGSFSNLPGKSVALGSRDCLITSLTGTPVHAWQPEDACFVACLYALLLSGPAVRAEEFNGCQLTPETLQPFLLERIAAYGGAPPPRGGAATGAWLETLARACAELRAQVIGSGVTPYRVINGLNLHKRERLLRPAIGYADVPPAIAEFLAGATGTPIAGARGFADVKDALEEFAPRLAAAAAPPGFSTAYEGFLHEFLLAITEAGGADTSMGRGPRSLAPLRAELRAAGRPPAQRPPAPIAAAAKDPLELRTADFFCCVTPSAAFAARFGGDRAGLIKCLSAYSARMRFNTWHYLPDTLGITGRSPGREDWFFAPSMADITQWSDQHHTGHVMFGVRYAIRIPLGIMLEGSYLPGLYDLRLMRAAEPPFELADLRAAIACGTVLAMVHQTMSGYDPQVSDFGNAWYRSYHAAP